MSLERMQLRQSAASNDSKTCPHPKSVYIAQETISQFCLINVVDANG